MAIEAVEWLEENGYDGLTDGRCSCTGGCLMRCGLVRNRRCSAAHLYPGTETVRHTRWQDWEKKLLR